MKLTGIGLTPDDLGFGVSGFRPYQLETAEKIINSTKRIIIYQGPTGSGKSITSLIPQRIMGDRRLILTRTRQLQDQYATQGIDALYGRQNYICNRFPIVSAAEGVCHQGVSCSLKFGGCDYYDQKELVSSRKVGVLNYRYFFLEANGPAKFSGYDWIIADEGHGIPSEIASSYSINISHADIHRLKLRSPRYKDILRTWLEWAKECRATVTKAATNSTNHAAIRLRDSIEKLSSIFDPDNWVLEHNKFRTTIRPIWIESLAYKYFWRHAKRFLLMSATIDPQYTLEQLGMPQSASEFINVPSTFPKDNRPVWLYTRHKVGFNSTEAEIDNLVADVDTIISKFPGKGLVHSTSYAMAQKICERSMHKKRIICHTPQDRALKYEEFAASKDKVLISPSMTEGVDLPYDMCRFQIIVKVPFPNRADLVWAARLLTDPTRGERAYTLETINSIVQSYGRGVRAEDDNCELFILDQNFNWLFRQNYERFSQYFSEAVRIITTI